MALAAGLGAAQLRHLTLKGKDGSFEITNYTSYSVEQDPKNPNAFSFLMRGKPLQANIEHQKLNIRAGQVDGKAARGTGHELLLELATLSGNVLVTAKRPSKAGGAAEQTVTVDTDSATYTQDLEKLAFKGSTTLAQSDPSARQSFRINGSSGNLFLYPPGAAPAARRAIKSMQLNGPVAFELKSVREVEVSKSPPRREFKPYTLRGSCRELTYDDATRKLVLNLNVKIDGNDPLFDMSTDAVRVTITLDDLGNPIKIEGEGEPGLTRVTPPPLFGLAPMALLK